MIEKNKKIRLIDVKNNWTIEKKNKGEKGKLFFSVILKGEDA
jgi:hypothetical protein